MKGYYKIGEIFSGSENISYGDYVFFRDSKDIQQVCGIIDHYVVCLSDMEYSVPVQDIIPLPISIELLERLSLLPNSGITKHTKNGKGYIFQFDCKKIKGTVELRYVHELQHLLRLIEG